MRSRHRSKKENCTSKYHQDHEDPENDIEAASPAGHVFAMIYHVGNACGQQKEVHSPTKNRNPIKHANDHVEPLIETSDSGAGLDHNIILPSRDRQRVREDEAQRVYTPKQRGSIVLCASAMFRAQSR